MTMILGLDEDGSSLATANPGYATANAPTAMAVINFRLVVFMVYLAFVI
jgi:hypothetical protein